MGQGSIPWRSTPVCASVVFRVIFIVTVSPELSHSRRRLTPTPVFQEAISPHKGLTTDATAMFDLFDAIALARSPVMK